MNYMCEDRFHFFNKYIMRKVILILVLLLTCSFSFSYNDMEYDSSTQSSVKLTLDSGQKIVDNAMKYIGYPYKWGSVGPKSFDCSGFVKWLYADMGINLNRTSREQYKHGVHVHRNNLQPGDLVFFARNKSPKSIYHVGIIVDSDSKGNYSFIHSTRGGVKISDSQRYDKRYLGAKRIFNNKI